MRLGIWNVRSLYIAGSLGTVSKELSKYRLVLVAVHFSMERGMRIMSWVQVFVHKNIISAVKRIEFVSDRMLYIILRGRWCHRGSERSCPNRRQN
jgi:hypothetical protein